MSNWYDWQNLQYPTNVEATPNWTAAIEQPIVQQQQPMPTIQEQQIQEPEQPKVKLKPVDYDPWEKAAQRLKGSVKREPIDGGFDSKFNNATENLPPIKMTKDMFEFGSKIVKGETKSFKEGLNKLFGTNEKERFQTWPEKMVRSAITLPKDVMTGKVPVPRPGQTLADFEKENPQGAADFRQRVLDLAGMQFGGSLVGSRMTNVDATLGSAPYLRPALKYQDKIYKAPKAGDKWGTHQDAIPGELRPTFEQMAMSGEDISHFNFGFMNHKGQFLSREKALDYAIKEGILDPHDAMYGALTTSILNESGKAGAPVAALGRDKFYSTVERAIDTIPQAKASGEQWLSTLQNRPGVKGEELDWIGLKDFLAGKKNENVTKQEIQDYVKNNKVELKEVKLGGITDKDTVKPSETASAKYMNEWNKLVEENRIISDKIAETYQGKNVQDRPALLQDQNKINSLMDDVHNKMVEDTIKEMGGLNKPTKFQSYQLPGGNNYREVLLTLPAKKVDPVSYAKKFYEDNSPLVPWEKLDDVSRQGWINAADDQVNKMGIGGNNYKSSHWDEPNVLAHVRANDRTIDGKKSLHIEEVQSDWHQSGRDKGYGEKTIYEPYVDGELRGQFNTRAEAEARVNRDRGHVNIRERKVSTGIPNAPFKKTWHELALKRMLREAAEGSYERLSWTPGEAQAARYDLSKHVKLLSAMKESGDKYLVYIEGKDGQPLFGREQGFSDHGQKSMSVGELERTVGKEVTKKIIEGKANKEGWIDVRDENLKVGGEGMKGFYDQIIPKALEKIGKEWGVKVKEGNVGAGENSWRATRFMRGIGRDQEIAAAKSKEELMNVLKDNEYLEKNGEFSGTIKQNTQPIFYIDIPPQMRQSINERGFPLFSGGLSFIPIDYNPFLKEENE